MGLDRRGADLQAELIHRTFDGRFHLERGCVARGRIEGHRSVDNRGDGFRHAGRDRCATLRTHERVQRRHLVGSVVRVAPRREVKEHRADRPEIGAAIDLEPRGLFGRHVVDLAFEHTGGRLVDPMSGLRDPEVDDLDRPAARHEKVVRRNVAMHDVEQRTLVIAQLVRGVKTRASVCRESQDHPEGQELPATRCLPVQNAERVSVEPLHHDVEQPVLLAEVDDLRDVRVNDARSDARLVEEHAPKLGMARVLREDELDGEQLLEAVHTLKARSPHRSHAPLRDRVEELVTMHPVAGTQRRDGRCGTHGCRSYLRGSRSHVERRPSPGRTSPGSKSGGRRSLPTRGQDLRPARTTALSCRSEK